MYMQCIYILYLSRYSGLYHQILIASLAAGCLLHSCKPNQQLFLLQLFVSLSALFYQVHLYTCLSPSPLLLAL